MFATPTATPGGWRAALAGAASLALSATVLQLWPGLQFDLFAAGAARVAGLFTGSAVFLLDEAWVLTFADRTVAVTSACSGTDFFLMAAALSGWRLAARGKSPLLVGVGAAAVALPVAVLVNALRIIAVTHAHRWVIPRLPDNYGSFAHMLTGAAVFLPALIILNLILEAYGNRARSAPAAAPSAPASAT